MQRFISLAGALLVFAIPGVVACAATAIDFPPVSDNAALQYWQAFGTLPVLTEAQEKLLDDLATVPLDEEVDKMLDQAQTSLLFMHRAAQLQHCDWGLDYRDGAKMYLPHLAKARMLSRVAALDARRAFERGDYERASDDVYAMTALARQVGKDYTLVSMLVSFAIEGMAVGIVAPYVTDVHPSYEDALKQYDLLPPRPTLAQGVLCEKRMAATIVTQLQAADHARPGSWREAWRGILGELEADPFKDLQSLPQLVAVIDGFQEIYDELAQLATLSPAEYDAQYPEFAKRTTAANPFAKIFLPAMESTVAAQRRCEARTAMGLAAIAVAESGPEKLADIKDPFGDGPFTYRQLDSGFELSSKLMEDGKPVTLVIGQKPQASTP